jgi:hypothetical protein
METQTVSKTTRSASTKAVAKQSMTEQAHTIFNRLHGKKSRKDIVEEFTSKVGLTPSSASTYYQKFLSDGGAKKSNRPPGASSRGRLPDESSKAGICRAIFRKLGGKKPRKDVLAAFIHDAELTPAGASTYYQKLKQAA